MDLQHVHFPYRAEPQVGLGQDQDGNKAAAYLCVSVDGSSKARFSKVVYNKLHQGYASKLAEEFHCDQKYIVPISLEEYKSAISQAEEDED